MEINNCEEYVLCELQYTKQQLKESEIIIENLKKELCEQATKNSESDTNRINKNSGVYYYYSVTYERYMEELLEALFGKKYSLDDAKYCLSDDNKLKELMKKQKYQYDRENEVMEENYQILLTYAGREYAVCINKNSHIIRLLDDKKYYHEDKKILAETNMIAEFKENLKKYIESEEKKLEENKDGSK